MGYDTSYHPLDMGMIRDRLHPWILGESPDDALDDLVSDAVRIAKVRFRANAWGLGLYKSEARPTSFEPHLHVWGRPFFVTGEDTATIAETIDRYLAAAPEQVDAIAQEQCELLAPGLAARVTPNMSGTLPDDETIFRQTRAWLDTCRTAVRLLRDGADTVTLPGGETADAAAVVQRDMHHALLEFAAHFRPGWMDRGVWPTAMAEVAGIDPELFVPNAALFLPIYRAFPQLDWFVADSIIENYMVGGCVLAEQVGTVREALLGARDSLREADYTPLSLRKVDEALADAEYRGMPFAEATEIYSGMSGTLN